MVTKLLTEFERIDERSGKFSKDTENIRKYTREDAELKSAVTELKNTIRGSTTD